MAVTGLDYIKSADRWQRYGEEYHNEGRTYYAETSKLALTVATLLFGIIGVLLQMNNSSRVESQNNNWLLAVGFLSSLASTFLGLILYPQINKFLNRTGDYYEKLSENMNRWILGNQISSGNKYPEDVSKDIELPSQPSVYILFIQLISLAIGFLSIAVYFMLYLFPLK